MSPPAPRPSFGWVLLAPATLYLLCFFFVPLAVILGFSFLTKTGDQVTLPLTLENFRRLVTDPVYLHVLLRSVKLSLATTVACLVLAYPLALFLHSLSGPTKMLGTALVVLPSWMNVLVKNYAWVVILRDYGLINTVLLKLGIVDQPIKLLFNQTAVVIGLVHTQLPFMVLPILAALSRLDRSLIEAAKDLGASGFAVFWHVIVPATRRGMMAGSVFVFVSSLGAFATPEILGGKDATMVATLIQIQVFNARDWPFSSAFAVMLMVVVLGSLMTMMKDPHEGKAVNT